MRLFIRLPMQNYTVRPELIDEAFKVRTVPGPSSYVVSHAASQLPPASLAFLISIAVVVCRYFKRRFCFALRKTKCPSLPTILTLEI